MGIVCAETKIVARGRTKLRVRDETYNPEPLTKGKKSAKKLGHLDIFWTPKIYPFPSGQYMPTAE